MTPVMIKEFKKPNLKAPRYREKSLNPLTPAFFNRLRKEYPELKDFSDTKLREIIWISNEQIWEDVFEYRHGVELPQSIGYIFVGSCPKKKGENIDYALSAKHQQVIQHRNWDSDQFLGTIFYTNYETRYPFKFHELWGFEPCRNFTRTMGTVYPTQWKKYIQVDPELRIAWLFRKEKNQERHDKKTAVLLQTYNELEGF